MTKETPRGQWENWVEKIENWPNHASTFGNQFSPMPASHRDQTTASLVDISWLTKIIKDDQHHGHSARIRSGFFSCCSSTKSIVEEQSSILNTQEKPPYHEMTSVSFSGTLQKSSDSFQRAPSNSLKGRIWARYFRTPASKNGSIIPTIWDYFAMMRHKNLQSSLHTARSSCQPDLGAFHHDIMVYLSFYMKVAEVAEVAEVDDNESKRWLYLHVLCTCIYSVHLIHLFFAFHFYSGAVIFVQLMSWWVRGQ